ncbi:hypothetical protein R0J87_13525 [Halomonas sp. SIMBA_159]
MVAQPLSRMMPMPISGGHAGPSTSGEGGSSDGMGSLTVGDYYASGSRVRKSEGISAFHLAAIVGAVALVVYLWRK